MKKVKKSGILFKEYQNKKIIFKYKIQNVATLHIIMLKNELLETNSKLPCSAFVLNQHLDCDGGAGMSDSYDYKSLKKAFLALFSLKKNIPYYDLVRKIITIKTVDEK